MMPWSMLITVLSIEMEKTVKTFFLIACIKEITEEFYFSMMLRRIVIEK